MGSRARLAAVLALAAACSPDGRTEAPQQQHEIIAAGELLTTAGRLREPGWARRQLLHWDPKRVNDRSRLRQWDFFTVANDTVAVNLTLTDLGFVQLGSVGVVELANSATHGASSLAGAPEDLSLSPAIDGSASLLIGGVPAMSFTTDETSSRVAINLPASLFGDAAQGSFIIHRPPSLQFLSLATPFREDPHFFFFEQKIPGMTAEGTLTVAGQTWTFDAADTTAVMDWGRGEWPSSVTWRWAGASGERDGAQLAFNLGDGFGDDSAATENLALVDGVAHKLAQVDWTHDPDDPLQDWTFQGRDGNVSLVLHPMAKELGGLDLGTKFEHVHKAYGRFAGTLVLDDGRSVSVDGLLGFAEEMNLAW